MSEIQVEPPKDDLDQLSIERKPEKGRLDWIDAARGFVILFLIATISFPGDSGLNLNIPFIYGIFNHSNVAGQITLYDIGAPAFIFLLGFTMPISYRKRKEEKGTGSAIRYILVRYFILLVLGFVAANIELEFLKYYSINLGTRFTYEGVGTIPISHRPVLFIIPWDVIFSIAASGLVGFIFMGVRNPRYRFFLGYGWLILYQVGLSSTVLEIYALQSVHGGIFGSIFGYGSIAIIATAMGDYLFFSDVFEAKKFQNLLIFGIANLVVVVLFFIEIRDRQLQSLIDAFPTYRKTVSLLYVMAAIGVSCSVLWVFYQINTRFKKNMTWLRIFGMNAFMLYFLAELPDTLFETIMGDVLEMDITWWLSLIWGILVLGYCTYVAWYLYKKNRRISTIKSGLIFLATIVGILLIIIILELTIGLGLLGIFK